MTNPPIRKDPLFWDLLIDFLIKDIISRPQLYPFFKGVYYINYILLSKEMFTRLILAFIQRCLQDKNKYLGNNKIEYIRMSKTIFIQSYYYLPFPTFRQ
jgi:hypothetical protein